MSRGAIAAGHPETAAAGVEMLRLGGNAADAAAAAAFASCIAESALTNFGGGGIAQIYNPADGQALAYDFFSTMPGLPAQRISSSRGLDFRRKVVDFGAAQQSFYIGRGSVAVPGMVAGLCQMLADLGRLPLAQVLKPAVELARRGVIHSEITAYIAGLLEPILTDTPELAKVYAPGNRMRAAGERVHFPGLERTLTDLGSEGPALFYGGRIGRQIVQDQQANGGLLTSQDLESYQVSRSLPIQVPYREHLILLPPASSTGGALLAFSLQLLAALPLGSWAPLGHRHVRALAEVMRLTNLARSKWQNGGNADLAAPAWFLGKENVARFRGELLKVLAMAGPSPDVRSPRQPANTTHISVADREGMVVSVTTSAGENAGYLVGDSGLILNNMLGETDLHPNGFYRLPPGQRLGTMMSPAIVMRKNRPILALGSGGSNRLRSAILQVITNVIDFGMEVQAAIEWPRVHFEEDILQLEAGYRPASADQLQAQGYQVNRWPAANMYFGGVHTVSRKSEQAAWSAFGDPRRGGTGRVV